MKLTRAQAVILTALSFSTTAVSVAPDASADGSHKVFFVTSYGARGDGLTDATAGINKAIAAAGANTGNVVSFPPGTYRYTGTIAATGVVLEGKSATLLAVNTASKLIVGGSNPSIENLNFQTNTTGIADAILVFNAQNLNVSGCTVGSGFGAGIALSNVTTARIVSNTFTLGNSSRGVLAQTSSSVSVTSNKISQTANATNVVGIATVSCTDVVVSANRLIGTGPSASNCVGIQTENSTSSQITANVVDDWTSPIQSLSDGTANINLNSISNSGSFGILSGGANGGSSSNLITDNIITTVAGAGIIVAGNVSPVTVNKNQVSAAGSYGIYGGPYSTFTTGGANLSVTANDISKVAQSGVTDAVIYTNQTAATSVQITDNKYKGSEANLRFFIHAVQPAIISVVSGNRTNNLLPSRIGP